MSCGHWYMLDWLNVGALMLVAISELLVFGLIGLLPNDPDPEIERAMSELESR